MDFNFDYSCDFGLSPVKSEDQAPPQELETSLGLGLSENSEPLVDDGGVPPTWNDQQYLEDSELVFANDEQLMKVLMQGGSPTEDLETSGSDPSFYGGFTMPSGIPDAGNHLLVKNDPTLPSIFAPATATSADKPKNSRKASHQPIQFSPPTYEESYDEDMPVKSESMVENLPMEGGRARRRKHSGSTDTMSCTSEISPTSKRPKLYEIDSPRAKNAKAAKANREKKKNELHTMKIQNDKLQKELETSRSRVHEMQLKAKEVEKELEIQKQISHSLSGLARVSLSAKSLLQSMLEAFHKDFDAKYKVEVPEWFHQAPANPDVLLGTEKFLNEGETSSFITFHVSQQLKTVRIDYNPEEPIVSNTIPGLKQ